MVLLTGFDDDDDDDLDTFDRRLLYEVVTRLFLLSKTCPPM